MTCVMCKQAETTSGKATMTFEESAAIIVIQHVPAQVCPNCGNLARFGHVCDCSRRAADGHSPD